MTDTYRRVSAKAFRRALAVHAQADESMTVLNVLSEVPGRVVSHSELLQAMYADDEEPDSAVDVLRVTIWRLRKRGLAIKTHHSRGYSLERAA